MLKFKVTNQIISRTDDFSVVADSRNYLTAEFAFSEEWQGDITAIFGYDGEFYQVFLDEANCCTVPFEVIKAPFFTVSVFCGTEGLVTANAVVVDVEKSGLADGEIPATPTPTVWQQYISEAQSLIENALPYIGDNYHWFLYNTEIGDYEDTGFLAKGTDGADGNDGYSPVRGTDYWTEDDQAAIAADLDARIANKQDRLNFDETPTEESVNPVTSGGIKSYVDSLKIKAIPHTNMSGYPIYVSDPLEKEQVIDYKIYGNSVQDGTPNAETPIPIQSVGDLVTDTSSEHYGKYDVPVVITGANMFGGTALKNRILQIGGVAQADDSVKIAARYISGKVIFNNFKENTVYTIVFSGYNTSTSSGTLNMSVRYTDGTDEALTFPSTSASKQLLVFTTNPSKSVSRIGGAWYTGDTVLYYKECGIFEGVVSKSEFEEYVGEINHIYVDEPLRSVSGYADYIDYKNQRLMRQVEVLDDTGTMTIDQSLGILSAPTEESITLPDFNTLASKAMSIFLGTTIKPSNIEVTYFQDINKVLNSLTNAILAQGGNV